MMRRKLTTADQLVAHGVGDYVVQSDWMALEKTKRWVPAVAHAATYTACFLPITRNPARLGIIGGTHLLIDHYRLARYIVFTKNQLVPGEFRYLWKDARATGYRDDRPDWMAVWLMIVADNCMHVLINGLALAEQKPTED